MKALQQAVLSNSHYQMLVTLKVFSLLAVKVTEDIKYIKFTRSRNRLYQQLSNRAPQKLLHLSLVFVHLVFGVKSALYLKIL